MKGSVSGGITAYADGDRDKTLEQLQGFARGAAGDSGPTVRCGDDNGRKDATAPTADDGQDDCG